MRFNENRLGRHFSLNIIPYFFPKFGKMLQNLPSAAVVIGALVVNWCLLHCQAKKAVLRLESLHRYADRPDRTVIAPIHKVCM